MGIEELEARIKNLEDIEAIRRLKGKYAYLADTKNAQEFMKLVTDDAVWEFGPLGRYVGKEEILKFTLNITVDTYSFMLHNFHEISIEVKGDTATGTWYFMVPASNQKEERAEWLAGVYEETYVKINGEWKFKKVITDMKFVAPYKEGWFGEAK
jgi:ketosteroid isomerase-like protein